MELQKNFLKVQKPIFYPKGFLRILRTNATTLTSLVKISVNMKRASAITIKIMVKLFLYLTKKEKLKNCDNNKKIVK